MRTINAVGSALVAPIRNIKRMKYEERVSVVVFIVFMALLVSITTYLSIKFQQKSFSGVLNAVLSGLTISAVFSILDRIGILTPIEFKLSQRFDDISTAINNANREIVGYGNYGSARHKLGFNSLVGLSVTTDDNRAATAKSEDIFLKKVTTAKPGNTINYMNSFITNDAHYVDEIERAVRSGVNVIMLLMEPEPECEALLSRFEDYYKDKNRYRTAREFADDVRPKYLSYVRLEEEIEKIRRSDKRCGKFKIRYYSKSLNYPILTIYNHDVDHVEVAYSGFYGTVEAKDMPWIEWIGGDYRIIDKIHDTFIQKFDSCEGNVYPKHPPQLF